MMRACRPRACATWRLVIVLIGALIGPVTAHAQTLEQRLDDEAFVRGLVELGLPDVLEHYLASHPPADRVDRMEHELIAMQVRRRQGLDDGGDDGGGDGGGDDAAARLEAILAQRRALIDAFPDHPRRASWLADQAGDLLFDLLEIDASGLTCLYGVPSREQRARAERVAREMGETLAEAEVEIERAILEIEAMPGYQSDEALQMRRRRLAREERELRIPFLIGVAEVLRGSLLEREARQRAVAFERGVARLGAVSDDLSGWLGARARRYTAHAMIERGRAADAVALVDAVLADPDVAETDRFAARLERLRIDRELEGDETALVKLDALDGELRGGDQILARVLVADQRYLLRRAMGDARPYDAYITLLDTPGEVDPALLQRVVLRRLADASPDVPPTGALPPIVVIAQAERLIRDGAVEAETSLALEALVEDDRLTERERAMALLTAARVCEVAGQPSDAVERYVTFATTFGARRESEAAIERAAIIGHGLVASAPDDPAASASLDRTLEILLDRFPGLPGIDRWRYLAARLALRRDDPRSAVRYLEDMSPDAAAWADAQFLLVRAHRALVRRAPNASAREVAADAFERAADRAEPAIADALLRANEPGRRPELAHHLAAIVVLRGETLLDVGQPTRALAAVDALDDEALAGDRTLLAGVLRLRLHAAKALEEPDRARRAIDAYLSVAPEQAVPVLTALLVAEVTDLVALVEADRADEARETAIRDLLPIVEMVEPWLDRTAATGLAVDALQRRLAESYALAGDPESALRLYDRLARRYPDSIEIILGRADALYELGGSRDADAMSLYRRLAAAGLSAGHAAYWSSQLRMLEILDRTGRNTQQIMPRINRLRLDDPDLGGPRYARRFGRLVQAYGTP